jgi:hypothetical protein
MLQTTTTAHASGLQPERSAIPPSVQVRTGERVAVRPEPRSEPAIDDALAASFPASDPPPWNPGLARACAEDTPEHRAPVFQPVAAPDLRAAPTHAPAEKPRPHRSEQSLLAALTSVTGAAGMMLLVPFVILLVGLPIAVAVRGVLEVVLWLFPGMR